MTNRISLAAVAVGLAPGAAPPASALVRFGPGVFIGGHNFSHRTFGPKRRLLVDLYDRTPRGAGCRWRAYARSGRIEVCHLRRR